MNLPAGKEALLPVVASSSMQGVPDTAGGAMQRSPSLAVLQGDAEISISSSSGTDSASEVSVSRPADFSQWAHPALMQGDDTSPSNSSLTDSSASDKSGKAVAFGSGEL